MAWKQTEAEWVKVSKVIYQKVHLVVNLRTMTLAFKGLSHCLS